MSLFWGGVLGFFVGVCVCVSLVLVYLLATEGGE